MKWVTRAQVGIDRMGSAWLIKRFIDPNAEFAFVPAATSPLPPDAEPFDISGSRLSHRGAHSSFHTILAEYQLTDPVLSRLASIVDEADVAQVVNVEAMAPGLDAICRGIRISAPDDWAALERGNMIFEALYAHLAAEGQSTRNAR
jgi:hypothetical protein